MTGANTQHRVDMRPKWSSCIPTMSSGTNRRSVVQSSAQFESEKEVHRLVRCVIKTPKHCSVTRWSPMFPATQQFHRMESLPNPGEHVNGLGSWASLVWGPLFLTSNRCGPPNTFFQDPGFLTGSRFESSQYSLEKVPIKSLGGSGWFWWLLATMDLRQQPESGPSDNYYIWKFRELRREEIFKSRCKNRLHVIIYKMGPIYD
jgi:hypothetical protein